MLKTPDRDYGKAKVYDQKRLKRCYLSTWTLRDATADKNGGMQIPIFEAYKDMSAS